MHTSPPNSDLFAADVKFSKNNLHITLTDGSEISVPLKLFPRLQNADEISRNHWRLIGNGIGIHWDDLDEDISVAGLLKLK